MLKKMEFDLKNFDSYKEDNRREVKKAEGGLPVSLWESYSAMANTYGGVIICGVGERKDGSWYTTGMKDVSKLKKNFWNQANDRKKISINLLNEKDVKDYKVGDDVVLVIYVPRAKRDQRPVYINDDLFGGSFKRNWEGDYHCTSEEVKAMLRDQAQQTSDTKILLEESIDDLDQDSLKRYTEWFASVHKGHAWTKQRREDFLQRIGAAREADGVVHPTAAGLLMFGQEYRIEYEYPMYFLDYREHLMEGVRWTDRVQSQSPDWSGNVFDFFQMVSPKLVRDLPKPFKLSNMVRIDETPVHDAVREALVNSLANTDFYLSRGVVIEKYPDKITLRNPGTSIVGKHQMLRGGESEPRNGNIMKMFNLLGYGEHAGSGVPDIYSVWDDAGFENPMVEEIFGDDTPAKTVLTLPLVVRDFHNQSKKGDEKGDEKGDDNEVTDSKRLDWDLRKAEIIEIISKDGRESISSMTEKTDMTRRQVERTLQMLKDEGKLTHEGHAKGGKWVIRK